MESFLDGLKFWGPFVGFCVAFIGFGWRVLNRREDKLDARFRESINLLQEDTRRRDDKLDGRFKESIDLLREDTRRGDDRLETQIEKSINLLREDMRQINARLDANSQAIHADIRALTDKSRLTLTTSG